MSATARALANKENAQHSTGPRTEAGKRASSLNALRFGLTSQLVVLPTEDHEAYAAFRANLLADLKPEGATEQMLAQTLCDTHWRLERARAAEANILALAQFDPLPAHVTATHPSQVAALKEGQAWIKHERVLRNLQHQEARLQRLLLKTLADLKSLQELRASDSQRRLDEAAQTNIHSHSNNLPFNPAQLGFVFTDPEREAELKPHQIPADLAAFRQACGPRG